MLASLKALIKNNGPYSPSADSPPEDAPEVQLTAKRADAPSYKEGEKVSLCIPRTYIYMYVRIQRYMRRHVCTIGHLQVATRKAFGTALLKLAKNNNRVINVDGDVKNSTFSIDLEVIA